MFVLKLLKNLDYIDIYRYHNFDIYRYEKKWYRDITSLFNLWLVPLIPPAGPTTFIELICWFGWIHLVTFSWLWILKYWIKPPLSLLSDIVDKPSISSLFSYTRNLICWTSFVARRWTVSNNSMSFFRWGFHTCTQYSKCGLTYFVRSGHDPCYCFLFSLDLFYFVKLCATWFFFFWN